MQAVSIGPTVLVDGRDCAFAKAVQLPDGTLACSYGVGGGPEVWGGSEWSLSRDGGRTWEHGGVILPRQECGDTTITNALKLSLSADARTLYAYGGRYYRGGEARFGSGRNEAVLCTSPDAGRTWEGPRVLPFDRPYPLEISDAILCLPDGRLVAPAALLPAEDRLGEQVIGLVSEDGGMTWPRTTVVFEHPARRHGYFEHKFALLPDGAVLAVCWTVTLDRELVDQPNSFAISRDRGETWTTPRSTGIQGQTMCPLALDRHTLLVAYNRRYGRQGIVVALVRLEDDAWQVESETLAYDAEAVLEEGVAGTGVETFDAFRFGFPSFLRLQDGGILLTYWAQPPGTQHFGIYAARTEVAS